VPQPKKPKKRQHPRGNQSRFERSTISGSVAPAEDRVEAKARRGWPFWVGILGLVGVLLTIASQVLTQGPIYNAVFASKPKPEGRILFASIGQTLGGRSGPLSSYPGSLVLIVHLENRSDTPFVPVSYKLEMVIGDRIASGRAVDDEGYIPISFTGADSLTVVGKPGAWTACIPRSRSLVSPQRMHVPITRDKPIDGLIRFATTVGPDEMRRWRAIRLTVLGADGTEHAIDKSESQLGVGIFRRFEPDVKFVPGVESGACGRTSPNG